MPAAEQFLLRCGFFVAGKNKKPPQVFPERSKSGNRKTAAALYKELGQCGAVLAEGFLVALDADQNGPIEIHAQNGHEALSVDLLVLSQGNIEGLLGRQGHKAVNIRKGVYENSELFHTKSLRHCTNQKTSFIMLLWKLLSATDYSR
jgi:hypothetical protein